MDSQRTAFGTVLFGGFNKEDVYKYIEQLVIDHKTVCKCYEHQISDLKAEVASVSEELKNAAAECERVTAECETVKEEKAALQAELDALRANEEEAE